MKLNKLIAELQKMETRQPNIPVAFHFATEPGSRRSLVFAEVSIENGECSFVVSSDEDTAAGYRENAEIRREQEGR